MEEEKKVALPPLAEKKVEPIVSVEAPRRGRPPMEKKEESKIILKNTRGEDMKEKDYFFAKTDKGGIAPPYFNKVCGFPVDREDLLEVFNRIFDPKENILFYKTQNKEVYVVIIPIKNSTVIGDFNDSMDGDFQKHALSFINEGSVNLDTFKMKLKRILPFVKMSEK